MLSKTANGIRKVFQACLCILVVFSLSAGSPAPARDEGTADKLVAMEKMLFGKVSPEKSLAERITAIEKNLFGQAGTGSLNSRFSRIETLLYGRSAPASEPGVAPDRKSQKVETGKSSSTMHQGHVEVSREAAARVNGLLSTGLDSFSKGNLQKAEASFHEVLQHDPNNPDAFFNLGVVAEKRGDLLASLYFYQVAQKLRPQDADVQEAVLSVENKLCARELVRNSSLQAQPVQSRVGDPTLSVSPAEMPRNTAQPGQGSGLAATLGRAAVIMGVQVAPIPGGVKCPLCRIMRLGL